MAQATPGPAAVQRDPTRTRWAQMRVRNWYASFFRIVRLIKSTCLRMERCTLGSGTRSKRGAQRAQAMPDCHCPEGYKTTLSHLRGASAVRLALAACTPFGRRDAAPQT